MIPIVKSSQDVSKMEKFAKLVLKRDLPSLFSIMKANLNMRLHLNSCYRRLVLIGLLCGTNKLAVIKIVRVPGDQELIFVVKTNLLW